MSLVFNMVGGGGDGELLPTDAILRVQAPAGSTVTISKGTVSKSDLGHENADDHLIYDYYFIIHQSQFDSVTAWTVTAERDGLSNSKTIIIDAADEYDLVLGRLNLYYFGKIETAVSGGLVNGRVTGVNSTITWNADNVRLYSQGSSTEGSNRAFRTSNTIDLTNYSKLGVEYSVLTGEARKNFGISTNQNALYDNSAGNFDAVAHPLAVDTPAYLDISSFSGNYYVVLSLCGNIGQNGTCNITKIWLEA